MAEFNTPDSGFQSVPKNFFAVAKQQRDAIALTELDGDDLIHISYGELARRVNVISQNFEKHSRVAVILPPSALQIAVYLAIQTAGACYIPIDTSAPPERVLAIIDDCKPHTIIISENTGHEPHTKFLATCESVDDSWPFITLDCAYTINAAHLYHTDKLQRRCNVALHPNSLAYIIYTSGSTGKPKGVAVEHRGVINYIQHQIEHFKYTPITRSIQMLPLGFDASLSEINVTLLGGANLIIPKGMRSDISSPGPHLLDIFERLVVTAACIAPAFLPLLDLRSRLYFSSLQTVVIGGEPCPARVISEWSSMVHLVNVYGPTESTVCTTTKTFSSSSDAYTSSLELGESVPNTNLYVYTDFPGSEASNNMQEGILFIESIGIARGYWNQPRLTAEKFLPNPYYHVSKPAALSRVYDTGDIVRIRYANGAKKIDFVGRADTQIKLRAQRIELGEIENTLLTIADIRQAIAIPIRNPSGDVHIGACIVPTTWPAPSSLIEKCRKELQKKLPLYMIPQQFLILEKLPLNQNEKVDKRALEDALQTQLAQQAIILGGDLNIHQNSLRNKIRDLCSSILNSVDITDDANLFLHGLHSLLTVKLIQGIRREFGISLLPSQLVTAPTIKGIYELVKSKASTSISTELQFEFSIHDYLKKYENSMPLPDIKPSSLRLPSSISNVLLIGATGFYGKYVLRELLSKESIGVLVVTRSGVEEKASDRVWNSLLSTIDRSSGTFEQHLEQLRHKFQMRVTVLDGNYDKERFGLSDEDYQLLASVEAVIFAGGLVNVLQHPDYLIEQSLPALRECLQLCCIGSPKRFVFVSSLSVFVSSDDSPTILDEHLSIGDVYGANTGATAISGYAISKIVVEYLVELAALHGIDVTIVRLGLLSFDTITGDMPASDWLHRFLQQIIEMRAAPSLPGYQTDITPVNWAAQALVKLMDYVATDTNMPCKRVFHIANTHHYSMDDIIQHCIKSQEYRLLPLDQWLQLVSDLPDSPFAVFSILWEGVDTQTAAKRLEKIMWPAHRFSFNTKHSMKLHGVPAPRITWDIFLRKMRLV